MARPRRLCILIPGHWTDVMGGAQYQADRLIKALTREGNYEIFYVARNYNEAYKPVDYKLLGISKPWGKKRGFLYLDTIKVLAALKKISPDIIYQRIGCAYTGIAAYYTRYNNCKMIWHVSSDNDVTPARLKLRQGTINKYIDRKFLEFGIRNAHHIITQTGAQANLLEKFYRRTNLTIVKNFHPLPTEVIEKTSPKVVWVANLKSLKQPEIFIKLAQDLEGLTTAKFLMIGEMQATHKERTYLEELLRGTKNLSYLGRLPQGEVNKILAESHLLVNTSLWEGFSNTFIQAWMRRVPVISLNVNPDNIFEARMLGLHSGSYEQLKLDVIRLLNDDKLRERMGLYSQAYSFENHSENNVKKIISIFNSFNYL